MDKSKITITATEEQQKILNKRWDEAGIGNDYIFSCVMRNESTFLQLMQRIFPELKLSKVERHSPQMTFYGPYGTKSVRYDVYSEINGRVFDVKMQMESRKNEARRARYYQCMMDEQELRKGEDYAVLPDSYVVMICPQDLFHQGRHIYRFRNYEQTDRNLELRDGTTKVFLNTHGTGNDILPELKNFLNLINGNAPADEFCREVQEQVREAKKDAETRRNFMEFEYKQMLIAKDAREKALEEGRKLGLEEGIEKGHKLGLEEGIEKGHKKGIEEGIEKGRKEATLANYASLVQKGKLSLSDAISLSGLSEEEINGWIQVHSNT